MLIEIGGTTCLFLILEMFVILPLIGKIIEKKLNEQVIPPLKDYVNGILPAYTQDVLIPKIADLIKELISKFKISFRGSRGGQSKAINAMVERVLAGEDPYDLQGSYSNEVWDMGMEILKRVSSLLRRHPPEEEGTSVDDLGIGQPLPEA